MKIEKINENQIRCTLNNQDLTSRQLKISELAYGSEKAKSLFKDMMEQASYECGFEANDTPLMIEAVPISADCIVLTITKVDDPEELDTRFSKFAPSVHEEAYGDSLDEISQEVMDLFHKVQNSNNSLYQDLNRTDSLGEKKAVSSTKNANKNTAAEKEEKLSDCYNVYIINSLDHLIRLAHAVSNFEIAKNSVYKNKKTGEYCLYINGSGMSAEAFNKLCNVASEYGHFKNFAAGSESYLKEHFETVCEENALQSLSQV